MEPLALARQLAVGRMVIGAALVVAPGLAAGGWIGGASGDPAVGAVVRGLGGRDLAIGLGTFSALRTGESAGHWLLAGAISDFCDLAATVIAGRALPPTGRVGVAAI